MTAQQTQIPIGMSHAASMMSILSEQEQNRMMPGRITPADYAHAVHALVDLAQGSGSGSRAAAQTLLSLYNGKNWQCDLLDLCNLDPANFRECITAIRGRYEFKIEPHELIKNGDAIFDRLQDQWKALHIKNRGKK